MSTIAYKRGWFDGKFFFAALDSTRRARKLNWKEVAAESGVAASTLTRMSQGKRPDVDGFAAFIQWSGLDANEFLYALDKPQRRADTLAVISTCLSGDGNLSSDGARAIEEVIKVAYRRLRIS